MLRESISGGPVLPVHPDRIQGPDVSKPASPSDGLRLPVPFGGDVRRSLAPSTEGTVVCGPDPLLLSAPAAPRRAPQKSQQPTSTVS